MHVNQARETNQVRNEAPLWVRILRSGLAVFTLTFLLRLLVSWHLLHVTALSRYWHESEQGAIAQSILQGRGFASPYDEIQPTAWVGPIYPLVVAIAFRMLGAYSAASTYFLVALNVFFSAVTSVFVYAIGSRTFGAEVGAIAGWLWALCLPDAVMPLLMWDTCLSALIMTLGFLLSLALENSSSYLQWSAVGAFWGVACLLNPVLIAPVFVWALFWFLDRRQNRNLWRQLILSITLFLAVLAPWLIRNYRVFGKPVFVRSNLAAELYFGNLGFNSHPLGPSMEYQRLGEMNYVASKKQLFLEYVHNNSAEFGRHSLRRAFLFWIVPRIAERYWLFISILTFAGLGLALQEVTHKAVPFLIVFLTYPLVYYFSYIFPRYRHPIEPLMFVMAAYGLVRAVRFSLKLFFHLRPILIFKPDSRCLL